MRRGLLALILLLAGAIAASAQTAAPATTLSAPISGTADTTMAIASATGWLATTTSQQYFAVIDREFVGVRTVSATGGLIGITRGLVSSRATPHVSGAVVTFMRAAQILNYPPSGQCTRTAFGFVPIAVSGGPNIVSEIGTFYDCLGVAPNGQYVETNGAAVGLPILGSTVASATSITPTGTYFKVSGVTQITTIVLPAGAGVGFVVQLEPTGNFSTATGGNIGLASTAVTGKVLAMTWNGTAWQPSY